MMPSTRLILSGSRFRISPLQGPRRKPLASAKHDRPVGVIDRIQLTCQLYRLLGD